MSRSRRLSATSPRLVTRTRCFLFLGAAIGILAPAPAWAIIITSGNGQGNTTAPANDPGFANIGRKVPGQGSGTFIYLGNRKVLTAAHIGAADVVFGGTTYAAVGGSTVQLTNADSSPTDLVIFEIATDPGLPGVNISQSAPAVGANVVMIGAGLSRDTNQTYWQVDTSTPGNWVWNPGTQASHNASGFAYSSSSAVRWGTNSIANNNFDFTVPAGFVEGLFTQFIEGASSDEAQAATGDSGGAIFYENPGTSQWELAGLMISTASPATWSNVPANHGIFGQVTLAADLSAYRSQIIAAVPEPASWALLLAAAPGIWWLARRRR